MRVDRENAGLDDSLRDGQTPRQVGDEMVVHDVDVSDVRSRDLGELTRRSAMSQLRIDGLIVAFITHMLALAQAGHKHKIRAETVVP